MLLNGVFYRIERVINSSCEHTSGGPSAKCHCPRPNWRQRVRMELAKLSALVSAISLLSAAEILNHGSSPGNWTQLRPTRLLSAQEGGAA